jgi:hypothetical protein
VNGPHPVTVSGHVTGLSRTADLGHVRRATDLGRVSRTADLGSVRRAIDLGSVRRHAAPDRREAP